MRWETATLSSLRTKPGPSKSNQWQRPGWHHPGHWIKSDPASVLPLESSVTWTRKLFHCPINFFFNHLPSNRFYQFFERQMEFQGHQALVYARNNRLKAQPRVHVYPNCGHTTYLCSFGASVAIALMWAFHFRKKGSKEESIPQVVCSGLLVLTSVCDTQTSLGARTVMREP